MSRASALPQLLDKNLCFCKLENIVDQHTLFRAVNYKHISRFSSFYLHQDHFCCYNQRHLKFNPQKILDGWYKCSTFPINYSEFKCVSNCHYGYNQKPSFSDCQAWKKKIPLQPFEILENILTTSNDLYKLRFSDWLRWLCPPQLSRVIVHH